MKVIPRALERWGFGYRVVQAERASFIAPLEWRVKFDGRSASVKGGWRTACGSRRAVPVDWDDEALGSDDLAAEVGETDGRPPHSRVHRVQVAEGERFGHEAGRERCVFQLGADSFEPIADYLLVIEGELEADLGVENVIDSPPSRVCRVGAGDRLWKIGCKRKVGDRYDSHARVAVGVAVGGELFEVADEDVDLCLLD
jgi:hypothetical protein